MKGVRYVLLWLIMLEIHMYFRTKSPQHSIVVLPDITRRMFDIFMLQDVDFYMHFFQSVLCKPLFECTYSDVSTMCLEFKMSPDQTRSFLWHVREKCNVKWKQHAVSKTPRFIHRYIIRPKYIPFILLSFIRLCRCLGIVLMGIQRKILSSNVHLLIFPSCNPIPGRTIVLVCGLGFGYLQYMFLIHTLRKKSTVYVIELQYAIVQHYSEPVNSLQFIAETISKTLNKICKHPILISHSYGTLVAVHLNINFHIHILLDPICHIYNGPYLLDTYHSNLGRLIFRDAGLQNLCKLHANYMNFHYQSSNKKEIYVVGTHDTFNGGDKYITFLRKYGHRIKILQNFVHGQILLCPRHVMSLIYPK